MPSLPKHTLKAYDAELDELRALVSQMGGLAQSLLEDAIAALLLRDSKRATQLIAADKAIDTLEIEIERLAVQTIALRAPMADDLREIIGALKISAILERIGDYAKNIAKRATVLAEMDQFQHMAILPEMSRLASGMIKDTLDAFVERDADKAAAVRDRDPQVDSLYNALFRELLTYMMENQRAITPSTHLLFIAKNIERIGDHATNAAEVVYFSATGNALEATREKKDRTAFATLDDWQSK
ncbi:MAG: phosphate signaling complex protein PhoU [Pseudomonadota bacterium]